MKGLKLANPLIFEGIDGIEIHPKYIHNTANITASIGTEQSISTTADVKFSQISLTSNSGVNVSDSKWIIKKSGNQASDPVVFLPTGSLIITGSLSFDGNFSIPKDFNIDGKITATEIKTTNISASIVFQSGSTKFGDTIDDTHPFTGSFQMDIPANGKLSVKNATSDYLINEIRNESQPTSPFSTQPVTEFAAVNILAPFSANQRYNRKCFAKVATSITEDVGGTSTAIFNAVTASAPRSEDVSLFLQMEETSKDDFMFFRNGMLMETDALSIQQNGDELTVSVNTNSIGYSLKETDEIVAWGKFNS